jgi:hypothetical protein
MNNAIGNDLLRHCEKSARISTTKAAKYRNLAENASEPSRAAWYLSLQKRYESHADNWDQRAALLRKVLELPGGKVTAKGRDAARGEVALVAWDTDGRAPLGDCGPILNITGDEWGGEKRVSILCHEPDYDGPSDPGTFSLPEARAIAYRILEVADQAEECK